jgi:hypothetical protein
MNWQAITDIFYLYRFWMKTVCSSLLVLFTWYGSVKDIRKDFYGMHEENPNILNYYKMNLYLLRHSYKFL